MIAKEGNLAARRLAARVPSTDVCLLADNFAVERRQRGHRRDEERLERIEAAADPADGAGAQPQSSETGAPAGPGCRFHCSAVITSATEPMINNAATTVRTVNFSPANAAPSMTATIGFTYA